eukprot:m.1347715 g.1347715  ORF g.1347715 m.1347715 type:complete len:56 (+) comp24912_c0_seq15:2952-3119(+)
MALSVSSGWVVACVVAGVRGRGCSSVGVEVDLYAWVLEIESCLCVGAPRVCCPTL